MDKTKDVSIQAKENSQEDTITTGVDKLLEYLEQKNNASLSEVYSKFKISKKILDQWIEALVHAGILEKNYTPQGVSLMIKGSDKKPISTPKSHNTHAGSIKLIQKIQMLFSGFFHGNK